MFWPAGYRTPPIYYVHESLNARFVAEEKRQDQDSDLKVRLGVVFTVYPDVYEVYTGDLY